MTRHVLDVDDLAAEELDAVVVLAEADLLPALLAGSGVAMVFEKPSARTRNSTEMAVFGLGGHPVCLQGNEVGLDHRETAEDVARTLACYHRVLCARVLDHSTLERMAGALDAAKVDVPVINLLSDRAHPCQAVADVLTMRKILAPGQRDPEALVGRIVAYVGDANNVCLSLAKAGVALGMEVRVASPSGYAFDGADSATIAHYAEQAGRGGRLLSFVDPAEAVRGADVLYTDVWTSMGQEAEAEERRAAFHGYAIDETLLEAAGPQAWVMHCLPAHRGEEISAAVLEGPRSVVWQQARARQDAMRGIFAFVLGAAAS
jgi:ornithine carbamoyltransferase